MAPGAPMQRQHYWNVTRGLLMLLGIPYHAALAYRTGGWIVSSPDQSPLLGPVADAIHVFRMPAFFIVAGYFAAMLLARRSPGAWLRGRLVRLGVPFLAALLLIVPPMNLMAELVGHRWAPAVATWRLNMAGSGGYWIRHLWFLVVLAYLAFAAAGAVRLRPALAAATVPEGVDRRVAGWFAPCLLAIGALVGGWEWLALDLFARAGLATNLWQQILRLDELIAYAPWFLLGVLLQRAPATLDRFGRRSWPVVLIGVAAMAAALLLLAHDPNGGAGRSIGSIAAIAVAQAVIATARGRFDRPSRIVARLVDASFVIYLVHLPIVILLVGLFAHLPGPPLIEFLTVVALTLAASYAIARLVGRVRLLDLLFNGRTGQPAHAPLGAANSMGARNG